MSDKNSDNNNNNNGNAPGSRPRKVTVGRVYAISTLLAVIIAVPASVVTVVMHYVIRADLAVTLVSGIITFFIAMGVGIKLSKKLAGIQQKNDGTSA